MDEIFEIELQLNNDAEDEVELDYSINLIEWEPEMIQLKIDFDNPLYISQGYDMDQMSIKIREESRELFVSQLSGEALDKEKLMIGSSVDIPKQLPPLISEEALEASTAVGTGGLSFFLVLNIGLSAVIKSAIN